MIQKLLCTIVTMDEMKHKNGTLRVKKKKKKLLSSSENMKVSAAQTEEISYNVPVTI